MSSLGYKKATEVAGTWIIIFLVSQQKDWALWHSKEKRCFFKFPNEEEEKQCELLLKLVIPPSHNA